jgi:hypothetical protein
MIDDFFQQQPYVSAQPIPKSKWRYLFRCLFYTSIAGFISGSTFGYLHIKGWMPDAEEGLILYGVTFGMGAILSTFFVFYQARQGRLKSEKIRRFKVPHLSREKK